MVYENDGHTRNQNIEINDEILNDEIFILK